MVNRNYFSVLACIPASLILVSCGGDSSSTGSATSGSTTATAASSPGAPTIGAATAGNASASIAFTAPSSTGSSAITAYTATCTGGGATKSATGTTSPISVTGLTNDTTYSCSVTATNSSGTGAASGTVSVTPSGLTAVAVSTADVYCPYSQSTYVTSTGLTSKSSWTCASGKRTISANGLPDHETGTFPNTNNPNAMSAQTYDGSTTLSPVLSGSVSLSSVSYPALALNGVKFDPATAGTCPSTATNNASCNLANGTDSWHIEALGQSTFSFGTDSNNAHVQPGGAYHYHGMPEGTLAKNGVTAAAPKMLLIGWAPDGFPVYARYGRTSAKDATSALKVMTSSYQLKTTPSSGRPSTSVIPMGAFTEDYEYKAGSGDLDECNGRFDVTPEFRDGIYHYYATDTYPFLTRCWKGASPIWSK